MATLYEIDNDLYECVDQETGEIIDSDKLNALLMERSIKIENVALWVKELDACAAAIKAERAALEKRMKAAEIKAKSLRLWLSEALNEQRFETSKVCVTFRKSISTEVDEARLPQEWSVKKVTYTPDKTSIKAALLKGEVIIGAKLVEKKNIQIR